MEDVEKRKNFIINVTYIALGGMLAYLAFRYVLGWVLPFILAFIIVSLMRPVINRVKKIFRTQRRIVPILVLAVLYVALGFLLAFLFTNLFFIARELVMRLPAYYESSAGPAFNTILESVSRYFYQLPPEMQAQMATIRAAFTDSLRNSILSISQRGGAWITSMTSRIPAAVLTLAFTILLSFFISIQYEEVVAFAKRHLPSRAVEMAASLKTIGKDTVWSYLKAAGTLMCITFVELSAGFLLLRTPKAIPIAAGIALFDALPFLGTGAIVLPWALVELLKGNYSYGFGIALLYGVVAVVRNLVEPKVVGDKLGLNPIVSVVAIYFGFRLFGVLGMIAMPMIVQIVIQLHRRGDITIFRELSAANKNGEPAPENSPEDQ